MKESLCRRILNVGAVVGISLTAGCIGAGVKTEVGTTHNHFGSGPTASQVVSGQPQMKVQAQARTPVPTKQIILLNEQRDLLRLRVVSVGAGADEKTLAANVARRTLGALSADDAKIVSGGNADLKLTIRSRLSTVDRDGDYFRMNCEVDAEMSSSDGKRIFGVKNIQVVSPRRILGKGAAISKLGNAAADAAAEWCRKELKRIAGAEVGAVMLSVQLPPAPKGKPRDPAVDAANIKAIGDNLAKLPNLVTYELVGQDTETGACRYRVVYFISEYPNGISNEVGALVKSIRQK